MQNEQVFRNQGTNSNYRSVLKVTNDKRAQDQNHSAHKKMRPYAKLAWMGLAHLPIMYVIMFAMVDTWGDVFHNVNTLYMALMMAAPMVAIMPFTMKEMYPDKRKNALVVLGSFFVLMVSFAGIRYQWGVGDGQFIRSMIPHHSGAILMCRDASITDGELKNLCENISRGQRKEIDDMNRILQRLN